MYYCCKGIGDCCESVCKCCDETCNSLCECIQSCCKCFFDAISQIFKSPFSFCTFVSSCITFIPTILMIVALTSTQDIKCKETQYKSSLLVLGLCNFVNFIFCIYLVCQYGKKYKKQNKEGQEEMNILQRTKNLIMYDFVVCFYIFGLIFNIIWLSMSYDVYGKEPSESICKNNESNNLGQAFLYNLVALTIYLVGGLFVFFFTLLIYACDEGSCTIIECFSCWCLLFTCGCWDPCQKKRRQKREENEQYRKQYRSQRSGWIQNSKNCLYSCGLFRSSEPQYSYQNSGQQNQQAEENENENCLGQICTGLLGICCCCCCASDKKKQDKYAQKQPNNNFQEQPKNNVQIQMNNQQLNQNQGQYQGYNPQNQAQYPIYQQQQQWQPQMQQPVTMQNPQFIQYNPNQDQNNFIQQQNFQQPQFNQQYPQYQQNQQQPQKQEQGLLQKMKDKFNNIVK